VVSHDFLSGGSVSEPGLRQADRIAFNDEPDMNSTILHIFDHMPGRIPVPATYRPLSTAFDAVLDALFFSLEPAVDKVASRRIGDRSVMPYKHPYAAFDAPAYLRRGRLIPELDRSKR